MEPLGQRLIRLREERGMRQADLARRANLPRQTISNIEVGRVVHPRLDILEVIAAALGITVDVLLGHQPPQPPVTTDALARAVAASVRELLTTDSRLRTVQLVPRVDGSIPASTSWAMGDVYAELPAAVAGRFVALTTRGDCMEPAVRDGESVVIDTEASPRVGDVIAALIQGEWTLKRLRHRDGSWLLVPDNVNYDPIEIDPNVTRVLGVAVGIWRKL